MHLTPISPLVTHENKPRFLDLLKTKQKPSKLPSAGNRQEFREESDSYPPFGERVCGGGRERLKEKGEMERHHLTLWVPAALWGMLH